MEAAEKSQSTSIKEEMLDAVIQDNNNNVNKKPAVSKLQKLDVFVKYLLNKKIQEDLLDDNILEVVRKWLEPLPDKSLPNIKIRKELLIAMKVLHVDKTHLLESGIGRIVHFYVRNPTESKEVRNLAQELMNAWTIRISSVQD